MIIEKLKQFRQQSYESLGNGKDALFELMDAVLLSRKATSLVEMSLVPVFRRRWPSVYEALEDSHPDSQKLQKQYIEQIPSTERIVLVGDHTSWSRPEAVTLRERTYEHAGAGIGGGKPITLGQGYSSIAWLPEDQGSWALPLSHQRITSADNPLSLGAKQLRQICAQLPTRPLSLWDSEYANASFLKQVNDVEADFLMRLRPNRCLWRAAPPYEGKGRPRKHGARFKLNDEMTWGQPELEVEINDPKWGKVVLSQWHQLHFYQAPKHPMSVIQVQRKNPSSERELKPLWLCWFGKTQPTLEKLFQCYLRRFAIEHWYRFIKQRLHWCVPKLGTPEASERWSHLMPIMTWQLWLARAVVADRPLPWQKPFNADALSPGRVAQAFGGVLAAIGTPARPPKLRGKSPGWLKGAPRTPRKRYPTVKKGRGQFQSRQKSRRSSA